MNKYQMQRVFMGKSQLYHLCSQYQNSGWLFPWKNACRRQAFFTSAVAGGILAFLALVGVCSLLGL